MEWMEELPMNCPPKEAESPNDDSFYRLVKNLPPINEDFYSQRKLFPQKKFHVSECQALSVSIFKNLSDCKKINKLPLYKNSYIVKIVLTPESGLVLKTGKSEQSHYSWWIRKDFDTISPCEVIGE